MKIALFTDGIYPYVIGGMQKHSYCLAKYLALKKVYVDLYHTPLFGKRNSEIEALNCFSEKEKKFIRPYLVDFPKYSGLPGHYLRESYEHSVRLYNLFLQKDSVDFVYAKGFTGWKFIEEKKMEKKLPPIGVKFHGLEMFQRSTSIKERIHRKIFYQAPVIYNSRNADYVFSYGGKISDIILKLKVEQNRLIEIPSAVEESWLDLQIKSKANSRKFIFIGRYERRKGIEELSQAIKNILSNNDLYRKNFEFYFIGPIPEEKKIKSDKVKYFGSISDPEKIKATLSDADFIVTPSYSEGMPNVILEAMSRGLAVIATDVGAVNCLVSDENGFLLPQCSVKNIEEAIKNSIALSDEDLIKMKNNSINKIRTNFLWEKVIDKLIAEIERIVK